MLLFTAPKGNPVEIAAFYDFLQITISYTE